MTKQSESSIGTPNLLVSLKNTILIGDIVRLQELVQQKLPSSYMKYGWALRDALQNNHMDIASILVGAGADFDKRKPLDPGYAKLLPEIVKSSNQKYHKLAVLMMKRGADVNVCVNGDTPLSCALRSGYNIEMMRELLKHGARVSSYQIYEAANRPNAAEVIALLVGGYVDEETRRRRVINALFHCVEVVSDESAVVAAVNLLIDTESSTAKLSKAQEILSCAIRAEKLKLAQLFIERGFGVNGLAQDIVTPLYAASVFQQSSIVKSLIAAGADVNAISDVSPDFSAKAYPIHAACQIGSEEIIQILLRNGADIQATDCRGCTPFSEMYFEGFLSPAHQMVIRYLAMLISKGKSIDENDLQCIVSCPEMYEYYTHCCNELEKMKVTKIVGDVSVFSVFQKNVGDLAFLIRNDNFLKKYHEIQRKLEFSIYKDEMDFVVENAKKRKNLLNDVQEVVCETLKNVVPLDPLEKILHCLHLSDIM